MIEVIMLITSDHTHILIEIETIIIVKEIFQGIETIEENLDIEHGHLGVDHHKTRIIGIVIIQPAIIIDDIICNN